MAIVFGCLLSGLAVRAQTTGSIQGRVFNPASKQYVHNAEVRLEGTNRVTYTENDGSFQFHSVAPGEVSISVIYTGYSTVKETVTVTPGQPAVREINLTSTSAAATTKESAIQLEAFTVSTEREGNARRSWPSAVIWISRPPFPRTFSAT